ncbi:MAG TPA: MXAN_5187 family protein [Polyangiaceae bacterium]|nr:MXAN_5187 family protein [Polyangiaceae bacterium]
MLLSRFWYVLLGLLLGLAIFVMSIATSMYNRAGARAMGEALSSDSQVVGWYLRDDARQRSGRLIQFGVDPDIAKYLQKSTESENKVPEEAKDKVLAALKKVNASIPKDDQFDAVFAVDQGGRVVAYLGYEQASGMSDFELGGYPVVADALRGYVRDDTLILDRIYRVVTRPVEYDTNSLPAGAIMGARIMDDRFARELSSRTGAAIAFYANGERVSSGSPEGFNTGQLDQIVGDMASLDQDDEYKDKGRSKVRTIGGLLGVQYSKLPGEAWQLGAGFAVARLPVAVDGPLGFFKTADDKDKQKGNLPLAMVIAVIAAAIGIVFSVFEHTRPIRIFQSEAARLAKGETDQLQPSRFRGLFRKIASDLNDGMDAVLAKGGGPRRGPADMKQVLGDIPDQPQMSAFSFPGDPSSAPAPTAPASSPRVPSAPSNPRVPRPPGRPGAPAPGVDLTMPEASIEDGSVQRRLPGAPGRPAAELAGWGGAPAELAEWHAVFNEFVNLKQQCGENTEGFTYEKFEQTLKKKNDELRNRHGAKRVKFSVYVKEGKAALKASPIMD